MEEPDAAAAAAPVKNDLRDLFDMTGYSLMVYKNQIELRPSLWPCVGRIVVIATDTSHSFCTGPVIFIFYFHLNAVKLS
jgi:hypothetical protein